jgi:hypothetical protein
MTKSSGNHFDAFTKALGSLYKSIEKTCWRHPNEKPEGSKASGKVASEGPERR